MVLSPHTFTLDVWSGFESKKKLLQILHILFCPVWKLFTYVPAENNKNEKEFVFECRKSKNIESFSKPKVPTKKTKAKKQSTAAHRHLNFLHRHFSWTKRIFRNNNVLQINLTSKLGFQKFVLDIVKRKRNLRYKRNSRLFSKQPNLKGKNDCYYNIVVNFTFCVRL